ncbi:MAG: hypothetical protein IJP98_06690 [Clostridia bacterium]|nr:hypothetical protein [Clostridia bacterium]
MKKQFIFILIAVLLLLCACQPTPETEFVGNKGDNVLEQKLYATAEPVMETMEIAGNPTAAPNVETVAEPTAAPMVQTFPERWDEDGITLRDYVTLSIHTNVETRADRQYPAYRTRGKQFTEEQIVRIADALLPHPVAREMLEAKTKKELEAELQQFLDQVAAWEEWAANGMQGDGDETGYDPEEVKQTTEWYMNEIKHAPDALDTVAVTDYSGYRIGQTVRYRTENGENATITSYGRDTRNYVILSNRCKHIGYLYWEHDYTGDKDDPTTDTNRYWKDSDLMREDAEAMLRQGLEKLGIEGFTVSAAEHATLFDASETSTVGVSGGWGFELKRSFDYPVFDIPYRISSVLEFSAEDGYLANEPIRTEYLCVFVDENGIEYFEYSGQKTVLSEVNPNVALLPFEDVQRIVKNTLSVCYPSLRYQGNENRQISLEIYRMMLTTQTLRVPDSTDYYEVPCWVVLFDGFHSNNPENRIDRRLSHDAIIINAVDGTVVFSESKR